MGKVTSDATAASAERAQIEVPGLSASAPGQEIPVAPPPADDEPKRKRGRPKGSKAAPEAAPAVTPEDMARTGKAFAVSFKAVAALLAARRGDHWALNEKECDTLGGVWAAAVAPYLPRIGPTVPFVTAAIVTWSVVAPRVEEDMARRKRVLPKGAEVPKTCDACGTELPNHLDGCPAK